MGVKKSTLIIDGDNKGAVNAINGTTARLGQAVTQVKGMQADMAGALSGFTTMWTNLPFIAAAATLGAVAGIGALIKSSIDAAESLEKMSQRAGVSVEFLSTLRFSAQLAGTDIEVMEKALQRLSRNLFEVSSGAGGTAQVALNQIGITATTTGGKIKNAEQVVYEIADRFKNMPDGVNKTAVALSLFGRAGADLIPMLNQGAEGLAKQREEARKLGLEISTNTAKQAAEFDDNMLRVRSSVVGLGNALAESLLPELVRMSAGMAAVARDGHSVSTVAGALITVIKVLATAFGAVGSGIYVAAHALGIFYATAAKVLTLQWGDIGAVWEKGFGQIKEFSLSVGNIFKAMWGGADQTKDAWAELQKQLEDEQNTEVIKKHQENWEKLSQTLKKEVANATLPELAAKIWEVDQRMKSMIADFPEHGGEIIKWAAAVKESILKAAIPEVTIEDSVPEDILTEFTDMEIKRYEMHQEALQNIRQLEIRNIQDTFTQRQAAIENNFQVELERYKRHYDDQIISQEDYNNLSTQLEIQRQQQLTELQEAEGQRRLSTVSDIFGQMAQAGQTFYEISGRQNKAAFAIYKTFATAQASIDTYQAALGAYKSLVGIPIVGPGLAIAAAAAATAFGLAKIAQINATSPGSGAAGGGAGTYPSIPSTPTQSNNDNRTLTYTINFYGSGYDQDKDKLARDLIEALSKAQSDRIIIRR